MPYIISKLYKILILFIISLHSSLVFSQSNDLPVCSPAIDSKRMHLCRFKEDLGGGLSVDFEMRNGVPYSSNFKKAIDGTYTLLAQYNSSKTLESGELDLRNASIYINLPDLIISGMNREFLALIDFSNLGGYSLSKRVRLQSISAQLNVNCQRKDLKFKNIKGFLDQMGNGDHLDLSSEKDLQISDAELNNEKDSPINISLLKILTTVCAQDVSNSINTARLNRDKINNVQQVENTSQKHPTYATRKALVIGNDNYKSIQTLKNAIADATAIARSLEISGYKVNLQLNLDEKKFKQTLRDFKYQIEGGDEVMFYFAGHGVEIANRNFLLPTDITFLNSEDSKNQDQLVEESIDLKRFMSELEERKTKFLLAVIDACRENPFPTKSGTRSIANKTGLAQTTPATGQMIIFSAGAGQKAIDNLGPSDRSPNGVFTRVFLNEMSKPGVTVDRILKNTRAEVSRIAKTVGANQNPAIYDESDGDFYFKFN